MKTVIQMVIVLFITSNTTLSQTRFNRGYFVSNMGNYASSILPTSDGAYLMVGNTLAPAGQPHPLLFIKTDSIGNMIWSNTIVYSITNGGVVVGNVIEVKDGYLVSGACAAYDSSGIGGNADPFLMKISYAGKMVWGKHCGSLKLNDGFTKVRQTADGGFICIGYTAKIINGQVLPDDAYMVKTDSAGNMQWERRYGGAKNEDGNDVVVTDDGGYVFSGYTNSYPGTTGAWLFKVSAQGDSLWQQVLTDTPGNYYPIFGMDKCADGGFIMAGMSVGTPDYKGFLWKTDAQGNKQWTKEHNRTTDYDELDGVKELPDGSFIAAGTSLDTAHLRGNPPNPNPSGWLLKVSPTGEQLWSRIYTYGYPPRIEDNYVNDMALTPDGGFVFCGYMFGPNDAWLVKTDADGCADSAGCVTSVQELKVGNYKYQLVPQPAVDQTVLRVQDTEQSGKNLSVTVYNLQGQLLSVKTEMLNNTEILIHTENLASGTYLYMLRADNEPVHTDKLIIIK